jgi:hypothetical protein
MIIYLKMSIKSQTVFEKFQCIASDLIARQKLKIYPKFICHLFFISKNLTTSVRF